MQVLLRIPRVKYGMSAAKGPRVLHKIDFMFSRVTWTEGRPERTRYKIPWMCGQVAKVGPKFFTKKPDGVPLCVTCFNHEALEASRAMRARHGNHEVRRAYERRVQR